MTNYLYLSPHFDDVALSCGGTISRQRREGTDVRVITVFGGYPSGGNKSCLVNSFHDVMGNPARLVDRRREEDRLAFRHLDCRPAVLDYPDAIYRGTMEENTFYYDSMASLFGEIRDEETELPDRIAHAVTARCEEETTVVAPLGLGGHVDHRIVHAASCRLPASVPVFFYEEFPYGDPQYPGLKGLGTASVHRPLEEVTGSGEWVSYLEPFAAIDLENKVTAISEYRSQQRLIFGQDPNWPLRVRIFSQRFDLEDPAERYWRLKNPPGTQ